MSAESLEPSKDDITHARYYIGLNKPKVSYVREPYDKHLWIRRKLAKELNIPEEELADEPDEMSDHSDDQGWDV